MKKCKSCNKNKYGKSFYTAYIYKNSRQLSSECKDCSNKRTIKYRKNNKEKGYSACIKHLYGITIEDYKIMFKNQKGKCAICNTNRMPKNQKRFNIDHNHQTGKVRGLLCQLCNSGLGKFKENKRALKRAIKYLETRD